MRKNIYFVLFTFNEDFVGRQLAANIFQLIAQINIPFSFQNKFKKVTDQEQNPGEHGMSNIPCLTHWNGHIAFYQSSNS